jgi:GNAT superfamily N-acetyltransferase
MVAGTVEIRPCRDEADELRSLAIWNAVCPRDAIGLRELRGFQKQVLAWSDVLAWRDGEAVGSLVTTIRRQRPEIAVAFLTVKPEARGRGVGSALYESASSWARSRGVDSLEAIVEDGDERSLAFARSRGFVENERNRRVVLRLTGVDPPAVEPPPGVEIVTWAERPELAAELYEVYAEAIADIPGQEDDDVPDYGSWLEHEMAGPGDPPDAVFVAVAEGRAVGFAKFSLNSARPDVAFHDLTGVRREWRGRGIAGALKRAQIAWAKERGYRELQTENEIRNTPIRVLNERLGYRPVADRIFLVGPLAPEPVD